MMIMSKEQICREYREAKSPGQQVQILADQNLCSNNEILKVLIASGMDVIEAGPRKPGGDNDRVLNLMYEFLDEIEEEIKETERKYLRVVESMKMYWAHCEGGKK